MDDSQIRCQNCEELIKAADNFCPHCGQNTDEKLTFGVLFYNTISNYFSFDARFLKSFIPLLFKPGYLAKKFVSGKRLLFLHPAQMYLFISVIFFFILSFSVNELAQDTDSSLKKADFDNIIVNIDEKQNDSIKDTLNLTGVLDPIKNNQNLLGLNEDDLKIADSIINKSQSEINKDITNREVESALGKQKNKIDSLLAVNADNETIYKAFGMGDNPNFLEKKAYEQGLKLYKRKGVSGIIHRFFDSVPIAMFFLLPIFALLLKIFYFRKKRGTYAHHLVFSFYYFSFLFTVFSFIFGLNRFYEIPDWIDWLIALSTFFYLVIAIIRFYRQNWVLSFFKTSLISIGFLLIVIPFSIAILLFFSFLFY